LIPAVGALKKQDAFKIFNPFSLCKKLLFASSYDSAGCRLLCLLYLHFKPFSFPIHGKKTANPQVRSYFFSFLFK